MDADNQSVSYKLESILAKCEKELVVMVEENQYGVQNNIELAENIRDVIYSMIDMIYKGVIETFCVTMYNNCHNSKAITIDDFNKLKPIYDKWSAIIESHHIDEQLYSDFFNEVSVFSIANPDFFEDKYPFIGVLEEKIWNAYFKKYAEKANQLRSRLQLVMDTQADNIDFLINSGFATISPFEFEELIERLFVKMGYSTILTPKTGDYGIDIIAKNDNDVIAVQAKKYSVGNNVGNRDVQRLLGAMQLSTVKANKSILITSSGFTVQATEQAKETPIELWNGEYIALLLKKYRP